MIGNKFKGLGKGLSALMGDIPVENIQTKSSSEKIPIHFIYANPSQPRKNFDLNLLNELSESIKEQGIIQPILVRKKSEENFEIVAGERRWRAAQLAKIHEVPVIVLNIDDKKSLEFAILENIQRSDLNGIEEALGYDNLVKKEQVFGTLKKNKSFNKDTNIKSLENELELSMGIKVDIKNKKNNSGEIKFSYKNLEQLNKIISVLKGYFR